MLFNKLEDKANESTKKQQKKIVKLPNESTKKEKNKSSDFILPDFNLKTQTVLNLFTEVKYDLKTVRDKKKFIFKSKIKIIISIIPSKNN